MKQSPTYSHEECKNCVRYDLDCDGNDLFDNTPEINQLLLDALKLVLDDPESLEGRPRTYKCVIDAIAAAEQQAQPESLTDDLPVSTLQRSISAASWATTKCFVTSPETDELPQLLIQAYCGNKEVNKAVARRVSAALNYCKGMNTAWLERAILAAAKAKRSA